MSTDSTELTFVRCPSCRSLVPAVSARCRMCGASLEAGEASEEEEKKTGRVRQRTNSKKQSELSSAANQLREQAEEDPAPVEAEPVEEPAEASADPVEEDEFEDPLGDYLEEVDAGEESEPETAAPEEPTPAPEEPAPVTNGMAAGEEEPAGDDGSRVIVETGRRTSKGKSKLSFGKGKKEESASPPPKKAKAKPEKAPPRREEPRREEPPAQKREAKPKQKPKQAPQPVEKIEPIPEEVEEQVEEPKEAREEAPVETPAQRSRPEPKKSPSRPAPQKGGQSGRLFGWLVTYEDPDGVSLELREGKFFVTGSSLKRSDLVLDHPTVSTPHAMVSVGVDGELKVQDLMSELGVWVKRRGDGDYQREEEAFSVGHGDWLRFGEIEYLVTLIAHVGVK